MHSTQIFLANPTALRVAYRLDDQRLEPWWSHLAGTSTDCADRNYSSRDAHLNVFADITLPGCNLGAFQHCDYDPYHCTLHLENQTLHLALRTDLAAVFLWCAQPQNVDFKTHRGETRTTASDTDLLVTHNAGSRSFEFTASLSNDSGDFRHGPAFEKLENYSWRGDSLHFFFGPQGKGLALEIDGTVIEGTLQVPESALKDGRSIRLVEAPESTLLLRSSVHLDHIDPCPNRSYHLQAFGLSFSAALTAFSLTDNSEYPIPHKIQSGDGLFHIDFTHQGSVILNYIS